jgi:hypothetical protein
MRIAVLVVGLSAFTLATGCSVRNDRVVEKPVPSTTQTTQRTTVSEPVPGYPAATTTTTTTTPVR